MLAYFVDYVGVAVVLDCYFLGLIKRYCYWCGGGCCCCVCVVCWGGWGCCVLLVWVVGVVVVVWVHFVCGWV